MKVDYDPAKRDLVLAERGLDLADAVELFDGFILRDATLPTVMWKAGSCRSARLARRLRS